MLYYRQPYPTQQPKSAGECVTGTRADRLSTRNSAHASRWVTRSSVSSQLSQETWVGVGGEIALAMRHPSVRLHYA